MITLDDLKIKIFTDGADIAGIRAAAESFSKIAGFTTNPTLMRQSGITDYEAFALEVIQVVGGRPVSFEIFADEPDEMLAQARRIARWGSNVNVKIPITNTGGRLMTDIVGILSREGVIVNVTAILTLDQVRDVAAALSPATPAIVSVFAGRIADTGVDPIPLMSEALVILRDRPLAELLWASPREVLNVVQADQIGCHIITMTPDLRKKLSLLGKDLRDYSLETVKMFRADAVAAGYRIDV